MKVPPDATVAPDKLTQYLLAERILRDAQAAKGDKAMNLPLYERVSLKSDIPEHGLRAGDIGCLIDYVPHPAGGEQGCVLEFFNAVGESIAVVTVPGSSVEPLRADEILSVRPLCQKG